MSSDQSDDAWQARQAIANAKTDDFPALVRIARLDTANDLRFADWSGCDFSGADLSGFDLTGARLHGCDFKGAQISGVRLDQAELGRVLHRPKRDPHLPAETTPIANPRDAVDWAKYVRTWRRAPNLGPDNHLPIGAIFQDAPFSPEMVVVPAGGAISTPFAIGRFALTFDEWDAAQAHPDWRTHAGIAARKANDHGWERGRQPAIDVSWEDAKAYCKWLSAVTGKTYGLPTEAELEHACRAGTTTEFWWGNEISTVQANYDGNYTFGSGKKGEYRQRTVPVDSFEANPWGLYQVHGNVWEWCEDAVGSSSRVLRGGSWYLNPSNLRSAYRGNNRPDSRNGDIGFRVARTLLPL